MNDQWTKNRPDGRRVNYTYEEVPGDGAVMTARVEGSSITCTTHSAGPMTREQVEAEFEAHLE